MASEQTVLLGTKENVVQAATYELASLQFIKRLWDKDPSLWSSDPDVQHLILNRLGWFSMPQVMLNNLPVLEELIKDVREAGYTRGLLLGMGGSALFAYVCRRTFGVASGFLDLSILDTTDPSAIRTHTECGELEKLLVIVSSKSGSTIEASALAQYFYSTLKSASPPAGVHGIAITDVGTLLSKRAKKWNFRKAFILDSSSGSDVGGRFSALTYFGLIPAALLGIDVTKLLGRAQEMFDKCSLNSSLSENPGLQLGAILGALAEAGCNKLTFLCSPALESFSMWAEQLVAESTGKSGKGIVPITGEALAELSSYGKDRLFVEMQLEGEIDEGIKEHADNLASAGFPIIRIRWQDKYDLGGEVAKWSVAIAAAGVLLKINPFDEPNVTESKDRTRDLLSEYTRENGFPEESPWFSDGEIAIYGTKTDKAPRTVSECITTFLSQLDPQDYVGILSFLPRNADIDKALRNLHKKISIGLNCATTFQVGPRYLHSTGQLYKGGGNRGVYLLLTSDESVDLPIPGESYTFGVLKYAQALGDFQAMHQRKRRVLRVHLGRRPDASIQRILASIDEMVSLRNKA